ncbi:hypothetical protein J5N97_009710 [Dioscorea zingiberensis]|uniref:Pesticidal crystal cry8Ba protein n=1 Tax=Dioscorea zingiberensis TaxID=325984 RepID=A0A9D5CWZ8_9LILI|nr:hypothetical protein J5N97_009710 [Dioscorea zingiberensis]
MPSVLSLNQCQDYVIQTGLRACDIFEKSAHERIPSGPSFSPSQVLFLHDLFGWYCTLYHLNQSAVLEAIMFTEGLDPHALRWVREGHAYSSSHQKGGDPLRGHRNGGRGLGIPPPEKFRSGHLPRGAIPVSMPVEDETDSGTDMDESSDTEEIYNGRYSLDSSPRDDVSERRMANGNSAAAATAAKRYATAPPRQHYYTSDGYGYSDFSSSRDTDQQLSQQQRMQGRANGYVEEESSDSGGSLEFSRSAGRSNGSVGVNSRGTYPVDSYSHNMPYREEVKADSEKEKRPSAPSAPPFQVYNKEINQADDQVLGSQSCGTPCAVGSDGSSIKEESVLHGNAGSSMAEQPTRIASSGVEAPASSGALPVRVPTFHASAQGPWHSVIAYDACVRLCLHSWARGCMEAPIFLENECALLRSAFGLKQTLLQSEEELLAKQSSELVSEGAAPKPKKTIGKLKVQVRKVRMSLDMPSGCSFSSFKSPSVNLESLRYRISNLQSTFSSGWESLRKIRVLHRLPANGSFSRNSLAYVRASTQYIKQVSALLRTGVTTLRNSSSYEIVQETYSCLLRVKSLTEKDGVKMQPGSSESHLFFPDSLGDDLIIEVYDSKGKFHGRVVAQLASIIENPNDKLRWWSIYSEPDHELVGRIQLYANYTTSLDENNLKCGSVAETVAYDIVLEVAMKVQQFQQRHLLLHGEWKWLLTEFASYFGVSDAYTKLRYLSYVMDVATPTADCLVLVHDLLLPVIMKSRGQNTLSHQENRILGEIEEQIDQILALVFENYKSLDEMSPSGMVEVFRAATGSPALALAPAVKLYTLLHDILSPEAQLKLCGYFQTAVKKRSRRHLVETDEFVASSNTEGNLMDVVTLSTAYQKMKTLCFNIRNEIFTDIEIHDQHVLPSFIDLPNLSASIYSVALCSRLRAFLVVCPPTGPSPPVAELVIATADFQKDLASWNISPVKGGVDAKELFHLYITLWIKDKRLSLLESCKLDKVKWSGVRTQYLTTPFVDEMYDRLKNTLSEYEIIICRWPEYTSVLEDAIEDIEKAVVEALEKQYADVLTPLKDIMTPKKFGLKYVQKLAKRNSLCPYDVSDELGIVLNSMKRLLDVLWPKIDMQLKSWGSCIPDGGSNAAGERLSEVTVTLRAKFRNYLQAVVEKLAENTRLQNATKLKKIIIQDPKNAVVESAIRSRMQPLKELLTQTINHLHTVFEVHVFVMVCRGYWDRMGQDVLNFLENRKENRSWCMASRVTVAVLDDTFASQMQQLLGNALQEKDLEPPRSIMEVRSMLCKDAPSHKDSSFYY